MTPSILVRNPVASTLRAAVVFMLLQAAVVLRGFPATLKLERAFPANHRIELSQLRDRDSLRHNRILHHHHQSSPGVIAFPTLGTYHPYRAGLYYTIIKMGSPPKEYYVQIDTGSDAFWINCSPCKGCPTSTGFEFPITFYYPLSSSTSSRISCSDQRCSQASGSSCSHHHCIYTLQYKDGSGTSGYYVSDLMHLKTIVSVSGVRHTSASVVFGCSTSESGPLVKSDKAVDGIFGFGQQGFSVISQLYSQGIAPGSFSHCLVGDDSEGGVLVLGQIIVPHMVWTPLVKSQPWYNINLESI